MNFAHPAEWIEELLQGKRETSNEPEALPLYSVSNRPAALVCQLHESAKWGLFSEGTELLESTPHKSEVVLSALDSTQPELNGDTGLVLLDLSRKSQVAVFGTKDPSDEIVFVTFEETGDIRTTLARVEREAGVPRLLTRSGICSVTSTIELATRRSRKPSVTELCEADADQCYTAAGEVAGGERFLLLKKACKLGHAAACDEAASLAQTVGDVANVALLKQLRSSATIGLRVQPPKDSAPNQVDPSVRVRKPLQKVH